MTHQDAIDTLAAERYLLDEMSELERHAFEEHYFTCAECARDLRVAAQLRAGAQSVFEARAADAEPAPAQARRGLVADMPGRAVWRPAIRTVLPWAAAAGLALALVYQMRAPGFDPQAVAAVPLRPVSRGAVTTVSLPAKGFLALALDVNAGSPGDGIVYRVAREDGTEAVAGSAAVPAPGTPLLLIVPADRLDPGGSFVVTLSGTGQPAGPPAEYRFRAVPR
jgi:hypothetical protein